MNQRFEGWKAVANKLRQHAKREEAAEKSSRAGGARLDHGQRASLRAIAKRIGDNGVVIADEVGMGKTRIAVALARAVVECGGRVAVLIPPGLGFQWQEELRAGEVYVPEVLRGITGYFDAWRDSQDRKAQGPWFEKDIVLISHAFPNWQVRKSAKNGDKVSPLRWAMLPELLARHRAKLPNSYYLLDHASEPVVARTAGSILNAAGSRKTHAVTRALDEMTKALGETPWKRLLEQAEYVPEGRWRNLFAKTIGLGLGTFDLVIIDEAHKSRGTDSGLSVLLEHMLLQADHTRRFSMTATPVELGVDQWWQTLSRIGVSPDDLGFDYSDKSNPITAYADAVRRVRANWHQSEEARKAYMVAAARFKSCLSPYLLRRDKREDAAVIRFKAHAGQSAVDYRDTENPIRVDSKSLTPAWQEAVCAAEALSVLVKQSEDMDAKRLRLTFANGHGIATYLARPEKNQEEKPVGGRAARTSSKQALPQAGELKRRERAEWWRGVVSEVFNEHTDALLNHPAILEAVQAIEHAARQGEKVLVFGRFTAPMRTLTELLNAREMLRRLASGKPWPQEHIQERQGMSGGHDAWDVIRAAHAQLAAVLDLGRFSKERIAQQLKAQYQRLERRRKSFRDQMEDLLKAGFAQLLQAAHENGQSSSIVVLQRYEAGCASLPEKDRIALSRALFDTLTPPAHRGRARYDPIEIAENFCKLVEAASDRDDPDPDTGTPGTAGQRRGKKKVDFWHSVWERIRAEFGGPQGGFARLMYGQTELSTRRIIQLSFNRPSSFPQVLVAQSLVGREGLNLHEACRTIVLLHPEWNPAVVEQQIGRVDRVGSHWSKELDAAIGTCKVRLRNGARKGCSGKHKKGLPRIEVRPVIFTGTYDEFNWRVLRERWDDLRAQLHGIVIPPSEQLPDPGSRAMIAELEAHAPNFSPTGGVPVQPGKDADQHA